MVEDGGWTSTDAGRSDPAAKIAQSAKGWGKLSSVQEKHPAQDSCFQALKGAVSELRQHRKAKGAELRLHLLLVDILPVRDAFVIVITLTALFLWYR